MVAAHLFSKLSVPTQETGDRLIVSAAGATSNTFSIT